MFEIMSNPASINALRMYKKGLKQKNNGGILVTLGTLGIFVAATIGGLAYQELDSDLSTLIKIPMYSIPLGILGVGTIMFTSGIITNSIGKKKMRNAIELYKNINFSNTELKFGFSPNSFKLALRF